MASYVIVFWKSLGFQFNYSRSIFREREAQNCINGSYLNKCILLLVFIWMNYKSCQENSLEEDA